MQTEHLLHTAPRIASGRPDELSSERGTHIPAGKMCQQWLGEFTREVDRLRSPTTTDGALQCLPQRSSSRTPHRNRLCEPLHIVDTSDANLEAGPTASNSTPLDKPPTSGPRVGCADGTRDAEPQQQPMDLMSELPRSGREPHPDRPGLLAARPAIGLEEAEEKVANHLGRCLPKKGLSRKGLLPGRLAIDASLATKIEHSVLFASAMREGQGHGELVGKLMGVTTKIRSDARSVVNDVLLHIDQVSRRLAAHISVASTADK